MALEVGLLFKEPYKITREDAEILAFISFIDSMEKVGVSKSQF